MSGKPPKKSDLGKRWMQQRQDRPRRIQPQYHLIVTEGTKTEPQYFSAIRDDINRQYRERIHLEIHGEGCHTMSLLERARAYVRQSANGYQHVWLVYDTDDFPAEEINQTAALCENYCTEETQYHALWSNQCIELWFLLHFGFLQSNIHRNAYAEKLTKHLNDMGAGDYAKNRPDMYQLLRPHLKSALENARHLDAQNSGKLPAEAAPGTKVYEFIEMLLPYLSQP